ncbi:4-hydroxy-tetrahydrodipicolinate reductase [Acidiferrobacter sp.]|uniref:4-hydroxy-tetrahydrodipicolinate reductase n=1 Tax=Acidiferrobacter sp. TaxID=1872107 RepID=UPI0026315659|nr:4-hydroxy-tetrahydrodipicolinate reductase [Acidiferrobacter sp.]
MRIAVAGATGRMGRAVLAALRAQPDICLSGALVRGGDPACGRDAAELIGGAPFGVPVSDVPEEVIAGCDALIDFTRPEASVHYAEIGARLGKALVIGTTGFSEAASERLRALAGKGRLVVAANMSVGVNLALHVLGIAARALPDADIEILEAHHRHKVDAPSGTALRLGEVAAAARGQRLAEVAVYDRHDERRARIPGSIGFASIRAGEIVGEHRVYLALPSERLEIAHVADNREVFAEGALRAARFLKDRPPGLYGMPDVLGLR